MAPRFASVPRRRANATRSACWAGPTPGTPIRVLARDEDLETKLADLPMDTIESVWLSGEARFPVCRTKFPSCGVQPGRSSRWMRRERLRTMSGAVHYGLPQIPQATEYLAACMFAQCASRSAQGRGECAKGIRHFAAMLGAGTIAGSTRSRRGPQLRTRYGRSRRSRLTKRARALLVLQS